MDNTLTCRLVAAMSAWAKRPLKVTVGATLRAAGAAGERGRGVRDGRKGQVLRHTAAHWFQQGAFHHHIRLTCRLWQLHGKRQGTQPYTMLTWRWRAVCTTA